jgi:hypothetical protein
MLCKRTSKNQLTIPKAIADQFPGVIDHCINKATLRV